ncbi:hypothetical protein BV22DRAFT_375864 [Leucogyrophana mollusca]|uniref:Uncharacterized protein n=1 Tax=Leucogyrophana mollusca TaxID=85980 RepID=A0ACB8BL68_9AGAM|nr:hypothetical protein BV22DRAFT_375864 [Leucogyrophana mollusca]
MRGLESPGASKTAAQTTDHVSSQSATSSQQKGTLSRTPRENRRDWAVADMQGTPSNTSEGRERFWESEAFSPTPRANRLLPPFSRQFSHLPTPQSPSTMGTYLQSIPHTSGSPASHRLQSGSVSWLPTELPPTSNQSPSNAFRARQILTPESSPLLMRSRSSTSLPSREKNSSFSAAVDGSPIPPSAKAESPPFLELSASPLVTHPSPSRDIIPRPEPLSPAADILPATPRDSKGRNVSTTPPRRSPILQSHDAFSAPSPLASYTTLSQESREEVGGEIARIRAQLLENQMTTAHEAEARRPDYLKRTKRSVPDVEITPGRGPAQEDGARVKAVGVTESPIKGRRLTLFQETSDESFEESLMAGGYGRYRSDWLHHLPCESNPQPIETQVFEDGMLLSERELKKQSRLAAFFDPPQASSSKTTLHPVEVEGAGRVLLNTATFDPPSSTRSSPTKRKRSRKGKKTVTLDALEEADTNVHETEVPLDRPNWPDAQFPWRLHVEQHNANSRAQQQERLRCIENFLDRDSDEEDEFEGLPLSQPQQLEERVVPGRGKMYPLVTRHREPGNPLSLATVLPSDPADARTALLSKRSVRALSYRRSRRQAFDDDSDGEVVCICNGRDDGRALVQCDDCHAWYHLQCIGIKNTAELGREEDPWFCANCAEEKTPSPPLRPSSSEPILVPTDEKPKLAESYDPPFFHAGLAASPSTPWGGSSRPPRTPPRSSAAGPYFSSGSSWDEPSSRHGPDTPQFPAQGVRVHTTSSPNSFDGFGFEESPFDPTSTPSRGIKFGAPFATPKYNMWPTRGQELFLTPTQPGRSDSGRHNPTTALHPSKVNGDDHSMPSFTPISSSFMSNNTPIGRPYHELNGRLPESPLAAKRPRRALESMTVSDMHQESKHERRRSQTSVE